MSTSVYRTKMTHAHTQRCIEYNKLREKAFCIVIEQANSALMLLHNAFSNTQTND
mgnify:CR=1 FL=1